MEDEKRLYNAAATGDIITLSELLESDPLLVQRVSFTCPNKTPLHVATMQGNTAFIHEILNLDAQLAEQLDSQQRSPLHIASAKGYLDIVKNLISAAPNMCMSRDYQGWNPLHLAAINGHVEVLAELIQAAPLAGKEKVDRGQTALHLCARHRHFEVFKCLVQGVADINVDARDDDGETVLHIAVMDNQIETTQYLVENTRIDVNATNSMGKTVRDILEQHPEYTELARILKPLLKRPQPEKWLTKKRDTIMVVAVLIATMAFQAGLNPPGGTWQDTLIQDGNGNPVASPHRAGEAIMAYRNGRVYKSFIQSDTVALVSSLSTILLLVSGLPFRHRLFVWILMVIMWLTVTSIAVTFAIGIIVLRPRKDRETVGNVMELGIGVWCGAMGILLVGNTVRLIDGMLKNMNVTLWRPRKLRDLVRNGGRVSPV